MPDPEEVPVLEELLNAHFGQVLEGDNEILPDEDLNAPPIDPLELGLGIINTTTNPLTPLSLPKSLVTARRAKRVAEELLPTPCSKLKIMCLTFILVKLVNLLLVKYWSNVFSATSLKSV